MFRSLILIGLIPLLARSQPDYSALDDHARKSTSAHNRSIESVLAYLMPAATNETEKARLIFTWITKNISYDATAYNTGVYPDMSAENVFKRKKAVCAGFSNLFEVMADQAGLNAVVILGHAKGYGYDERKARRIEGTNHAWNAVFADGQWLLIDATWGEGYATTEHGRMVSKKAFDPFWFGTDPGYFIYTHFPQPDDTPFQLLANPLSEEEYLELPHAFPTDFLNGSLPSVGTGVLTPDQTNTSGDPSVQPAKTKASFYTASYPTESTLKAGKSYLFRFASDDIFGIALNQDGDWSYLDETNGEWRGTFTPRPGTLKIVVMYPNRSKETMLTYQVE